jgi:hypothetical protein
VNVRVEIKNIYLKNGLSSQNLTGQLLQPFPTSLLTRVKLPTSLPKKVCTVLPDHGKPSQSSGHSVFRESPSPPRTDPRFLHTRLPQYLQQTSTYQRPPLKIRGHSTRPLRSPSVGPAPDHRVFPNCVPPRYFHSSALLVVVLNTTIQLVMCSMSGPRTVKKSSLPFRWVSLYARGAQFDCRIPSPTRSSSV